MHPEAPSAAGEEGSAQKRVYTPKSRMHLDKAPNIEEGSAQKRGGARTTALALAYGC
jgi:hypothetical protein